MDNNSSPPDDPASNDRAPNPPDASDNVLPSSSSPDLNSVEEATNDGVDVPEAIEQCHYPSKLPAGTSIDKYGGRLQQESATEYWIPAADSTKQIPTAWGNCMCNQCDNCASRLYNRYLGW